MVAKYGDDTLYRKIGRKYVPMGVTYRDNYIPDGIWYVHHKEFSHGTTSVPYIASMFKMGDTQKLDVNLICSMEELCNKIMDSDDWKELINRETGCTLNDIVHLCVKKIYDEGVISEKEKI